MRHTSGPALLVGVSLLLAACGGNGEAPRTEPSRVPSASVSATPDATPTPEESPTGSPSGTTAVTDGLDTSVVALLSDTAVGGTVDRRPVLVERRSDIRGFVRQFDSRVFARDVRRAILDAQLPEGHALLAAVAAVGCRTPAGVELVTRRGQLRVRAEAPDAPEIQCLAPMTTVGIFTVAEAATRGLRHNGAA